MERNIRKSRLDNISSATLCGHNRCLAVRLEFVEAGDLNPEAAVDTEVRKTSPVRKYRRVVSP